MDSRALPIDGDAFKEPSSRSKIFQDRKKEYHRFSIISSSESEGEEEPSPSPRSRKKMFGRIWDKYKPWGQKVKFKPRSESYCSSGDETGYETDEMELSSPLSLTEVTFDLLEEPEGVKNPAAAPEDRKMSAASKRLSARREELLSPLTLKTLDQGDAERALKKILEKKADEYDVKGQSFTRELKEFEEIVDHFIQENPALKFMTEEEKQGFIRANARSTSGASPLKPTRRSLVQ